MKKIILYLTCFSYFFFLFHLNFVYSKTLREINEDNLKILKQSFPFYTKTNGYMHLEWASYRYVKDIEEEEEDQYEILNTIQVYFSKDKNNLYNFFLKLDSQNVNVKYSLLYLKNKGWYKFKSSDTVKELTPKRVSSLVKTSIGIPTYFLYQDKNLLDEYIFSLTHNKKKHLYEITIKQKEELNDNYTKIYIDSKNYRYQKIEYIKHNILTKSSTFFYEESNNSKLFNYIKQHDDLSGKIIAKIRIKQVAFENPKLLPKSIFSYKKFANLYKE